MAGKKLDELEQLKSDCKELEIEFKPMMGKLNALAKRAKRVRDKMEISPIVTGVEDSRTTELGLKFFNWFCCDDLANSLPEAVESISNLLHNINVRNRRPKPV